MSGKRVVERYFEALDAGDASAIPELFSEDCEIFRPEIPTPLTGTEAMKVVVTMAHRIYEALETTVLRFYSGDDSADEDLTRWVEH